MQCRSALCAPADQNATLGAGRRGCEAAGVHSHVDDLSPTVRRGVGLSLLAVCPAGRSTQECRPVTFRSDL